MSVPLWFVDSVGVVSYLLSALVFLAIARRATKVLHFGKSSVASALAFSALGSSVYCVFVAARLLVTSGHLMGISGFVNGPLAFAMRFVFLATALVVWRSLQPNGE